MLLFCYHGFDESVPVTESPKAETERTEEDVERALEEAHVEKGDSDDTKVDVSGAQHPMLAAQM